VITILVQGCQMVSFWNQKLQFGQNLEGLRWENVAIFCSHLESFMNIWDILWPFGTFCVHLVPFSGFGIMRQEKSGNPVLVDFGRSMLHMTILVDFNRFPAWKIVAFLDKHCWLYLFLK
jgi:hypothetical protein